MPGDRAPEVPVGRAEAEPVEQRDRPRAHRDDVAEDAADAGRGALERLDRGRVVVRLDLERDREAAADVDDAGVLAGALQDALALRGQSPQERGGVLVAAVLRPEHREDGQLEVVRRPLEQFLDAPELPVGETERAMERLLRDGGQTTSLAVAPDAPQRCLAAAQAEAGAPLTRPPSRRLHLWDESPVDNHARCPRGDLGCLVHVHQGRRPGVRPAGARLAAGPARRRRAHPGRSGRGRPQGNRGRSGGSGPVASCSGS